MGAAGAVFYAMRDWGRCGVFIFFLLPFTAETEQAEAAGGSRIDTVGSAGIGVGFVAGFGRLRECEVFGIRFMNPRRMGCFAQSCGLRMHDSVSAGRLIGDGGFCRKHVLVHQRFFDEFLVWLKAFSGVQIKRVRRAGRLRQMA